EVDRQAGAQGAGAEQKSPPEAASPNGSMTGHPNSPAPNGNTPNGPMPNGPMPNGPAQSGPAPSGSAPNGPAPNGPSTDSIVVPDAMAAGGASAEPAAQLDALTSQVSRLSGNGDERAAASAALHNQQVGFLKNVLLNGMTPNRGLDIASAFLHRGRFLTRRAEAILRRSQQETQGLGLNDILSGLATGLLGSDGVVAHLLQGLGHVVEVLPQGLGKTLQAVGSIADNVVDDVFDILKLPKVDMSKVPEQERRIPYVAEIPDWWYHNNNLNATYAAQLRAQVHDIIDGFNSIPGYISPAVAHYISKKYADKY
ncbi:hypothetical protein LPJ61_005309, partial [Coemansia biformis]